MTRHTKIIATIGPSTAEEKDLLALMEADVNVFRFNFSHGSNKRKGEVIGMVRQVAARTGRVVALLGDLQGPKIRTGEMKNGALEVRSGTKVIITSRETIGKDGVISTGYRNLPGDVKKGDRILIDDGAIEFKVEGIKGQDVLCLVISGGTVKNHKGINLPGVEISAPALTGKDLEDVAFCVRHDLDFIALSFVRRASDIIQLKRYLQSLRSEIRVIAKIEKPEAIDDFDAILAAADGIMVARGDLGVEMNPEKVPLLQKNIIAKCNRAGKPVITATQMLESMIHNQQPSRAETSDVANAILDGTDAVMLSGETAIGKHPHLAIRVINRVALDIEQGLPRGNNTLSFFELDSRGRTVASVTEAIGQAACRVAAEVGAKAILAFTQTGNTATLVTKYRPSIPIYAVTPSTRVQRRMCMYSGVRALVVDFQGNTEAQIDEVEAAVLASGVLRNGSLVVITMGSPLSTPGTTNLLKIHRLSGG
ncbi:MAG: pyruvate kinase [Desulfobulbales bacterium]|nr:pyruvate kinase [Desulfobulbales bacterium]